MGSPSMEEVHKDCQDDFKREYQKLTAALEFSRAEAAGLVVQTAELRSNQCALAAAAASSSSNNRPSNELMPTELDGVTAPTTREELLRDQLSETQQQLDKIHEGLVLAEMARRNEDEEGQNASVCKISALELKLQQMDGQLQGARAEVQRHRADSNALPASRMQARRLQETLIESNTENLALKEQALRLEIECVQVKAMHFPVPVVSTWSGALLRVCALSGVYYESGQSKSSMSDDTRGCANFP